MMNSSMLSAAVCGSLRMPKASMMSKGTRVGPEFVRGGFGAVFYLPAADSRPHQGDLRDDGFGKREAHRF